MKTCALLLLLTACGEPISNAVFYEEASFLRALPDEDRLAGPAAMRTTAEAPDSLLAAASLAAEDLSDVLRPLIICADALSHAEPDERDLSFRSWDRVPVVLTLEDQTLDWWVRGTIVEGAAGAMSWTLDGARDRIGPWSELARGQHEPSGNGWMIWEVGVLLERLDLPGEGLIELRYGQQDGLRALQADFLSSELSADPLRTWIVVGEDTLVFSDQFALTTDGQDLPGYAVARHTDAGGRAEGVLWTGDDELSFLGCWNGAGETTFRGGSEGVHAQGDASACVLPPIDAPP